MIQDPRKAWLDGAITRWEKPMLRLCYAYLCDTAMAEDAVQETFFKAWKNYGKFRGDAEEKTWLTRIAINTCKDMLRSGWFRHMDRSVSVNTLPMRTEEPNPEGDAVTVEVMKLPVRLREVVLLYYFEDMNTNEIAETLRISQQAVSGRLLRARAKLRTALGDDERSERNG